LACIGPSTAAELEKYSLRADVVPSEFRAEALAAELRSKVSGQRALWVRASRSRDVLRKELTAAGALLEEVVVYQNRDVATLPANELGQIERGELDWIGLSSPSIARNLPNLLTPTARAQIGSRTHLASISPVTTAAAREAGLPIAVEATTYTWEGLFQAMIDSEGESQ
jgi:uroporphyrinogen III methyltransferase/synthase